MADEYLKISGTEVAPGSTGVHQKYKDTGSSHAQVVYVEGLDLSDAEITIAGVALPSAPLTDQVTVAAHGTAVPLAGASTPLVSGVRIKALAANTGDIYVGGASVDSATGFVLDAGEEVFVEVDDLASVYIDSDVDAEGVCYVGG